MKKFFKVLGYSILLLFATGIAFYFIKNESLPKGEKGKNADALALKMQNALNAEAFKNTEIIEWSFRNVHHYKWMKQQNKVEVSWDTNKVLLNTKNIAESKVISTLENSEKQKLIHQANAFFNNDSFWLVAHYKVFDKGTERSIVKVDNKDALLVTYTSGGSTPGDSYLWILDENYLPVSYKMWTSIIPIGGVSATWNNLKSTEAGIKLPINHTLNLFQMQLSLNNVKAYNQKANNLANKILKAIQHENYKKTTNIEWSFGGRRSYKWDKKNNIVDVMWDTIKVVLHTKNPTKSSIYFNNKIASKKNEKLITRATNLFNNDSFWLVAPHKLYEKGIIRTIQKVDGKDALLVKYTTGGTTPGDSYLWILDKNNVPKSYKMYVPSMKMNGVYATWEDWITTESGTLLPTNHTFSNGRKLSMGTVSAKKK